MFTLFRKEGVDAKHRGDAYIRHPGASRNGFPLSLRTHSRKQSFVCGEYDALSFWFRSPPRRAKSKRRGFVLA
jgi:hypothetical protein